MDKAVQNYRRMGFSISPRMYHPFGSANNLLMFKSTYLELLGIVKPDNVYGMGEMIKKALEQREGASHIALLSTDAKADYSEFVRKNIQPNEVAEFKRAVPLPDGSEINAVISVCVFDQSDTPKVNIFVSQQHVAKAIWVPEWQSHPNGAEDVLSVSIISDDPVTQFEPRFKALFGNDNCTQSEGESLTARTPNGVIEVMTATGFQDRFQGSQITIENTLPYIAATTVRVKDISIFDQVSTDNGIAVQKLANGGRLVAPEDANAIAIEFVE
jgi:hypothetical protein